MGRFVIPSDINKIEDLGYSPNIVNQFRLANDTGDLKYFALLDDSTDVDDIRNIRLFLKKCHLSDVRKSQFISFLEYHDNKFNKELPKIDAAKINDDNVEALTVCIDAGQYPDKLYNYDRTCSLLKKYLEAYFKGVDLDEFDWGMNASDELIQLKELGFDINKLKDQSDIKITEILDSVLDDRYNDILLDKRVTSENIEYIKYFLNNDYNVENLLNRSDKQIQKLYNLARDGMFFDDLIEKDYDDLLFSHLLENKLENYEIDEKKLIEFEQSCSDFYKREDIYSLWSTSRFYPDQMELLIKDYDFYKDRIEELGKIANYSAYDYLKVGKFLDKRFTVEQLKNICDQLDAENYSGLNKISIEMSPTAIENVFKVAGCGMDVYVLEDADYEENFETINMFYYLRLNKIPFDRSDPADYTNKYIQYSNKQMEDLYKLVKNDFIKTSDHKYKKNGICYKNIEYLLEYNKSHKPVAIMDYQYDDMRDLQKWFPIEDKVKDEMILPFE